MPSFLTASVLRDLSFRTRLGRRPHTINTDSLASLHSTQLARLTLTTTFFFPRSITCISDDGVSSSLIVGGARIQVEFAVAPPGATAGRQYRKAWKNLRRATARSTSSASHPPGIARAICVTALAMALARGEWSPKQPTPCKKSLAVHRFKLLTENARRRPWPVTSDHATADVNRPEQSTHSQRRPTGGRAARAASGRGRHGNLPT